MLLIPRPGRNNLVVCGGKEEKRRGKEVAYLGIVGMPPKSRFAIAHTPNIEASERERDAMLSKYTCSKVARAMVLVHGTFDRVYVDSRGVH